MKESLLALVQADIELRRAGKEYVGLCPFHVEKTPSFYVNEEKGLYLCRSCQAGGDLITYLVEKRGHSMREALRMVGKEMPPQDHAIEERKRQAREAVLFQFFCWKREQFRALDEVVRELHIAEVAWRSICRRPDLWTDEEADWWGLYLGDLYFHWERLVYETDQLVDEQPAWERWRETIS